MYLGVLHKGQDGQAAVFILLMLLAITATLVLGLRVTELAILRFDSQKAADAAALAGANIQARGKMLIALFKSLVITRNFVIAVMRIVSFILIAIGTELILTLVSSPIGSALCNAGRALNNARLSFEKGTTPFVMSLKSLIKAAQYIFPLYAIWNAVTYAAKNGALGIAVPFDWGWLEDILKRVGISPDTQPSPEDSPQPTCQDFIEVAETCACKDDLNYTRAAVSKLFDDIDEAKGHIEMQLTKKDDNPDPLSCQLAIKELLGKFDSVIKDLNSYFKDRIDNYKKNNESPCESVTIDIDPEQFRQVPWAYGYYPLGCPMSGEDVKKSIGYDSLVEDYNNCHDCKCFYDVLELFEILITGYFLPNNDIKCKEKVDELSNRLKEAQNEEIKKVINWVNTSLEEEVLHGFDGIAVIVIRKQGNLLQGNFSVDTRLRDGKEVGLVYAVAYGTTVQGDAILFKTWQESTRNRIANEEFGAMFLWFGFLNVLLGISNFFFEIVQWFHDIQNRPCGFFPCLPESFPNVFGVRDKWEELTKEATDLILKEFGLQNAPDMHEWRPALERFDVALVREDPSHTLQDLANLLDQVASGVQDALNATASVAGGIADSDELISLIRNGIPPNLQEHFDDIMNILRDPRGWLGTLF